MNRRGFLRAIAALPVVAMLAPIVPKQVTRFWQSADIDLTPAPTKPRYLRVRMTWAFKDNNFQQNQVATLGGFSREDAVTFRIPGEGLAEVKIEGSDDGVTWRQAPDEMKFSIQRFEE